MSPLALWKSATTPTVRGDHGQRAERVLLSALATLVAIGCLAFVAKLISLATGVSTGTSWLVWTGWVVAVTAAAAGAIRYARAGHHRQVAIGMVALLTLFAATMATASGIYGTTWAVLSTYCVVLAGTTLGHRAALTTAAAQVVLTLTIAAIETAGAIPTEQAPNDQPLADSIGVVLAFALAAQACWHYARDSGASVDEQLSGHSAHSPLLRLRTRTLTMREIEVVQLVAEGLPDSEIAKQLVISPRTVHTHVANALGKTGCANRTELGVLAVREGLAPMTAPDADTALAPA